MKVQLLLAVLSCDTAAVQAQVVRGRIAEQSSRAPVAGVGVLLLDRTNRPRMAALTDPTGYYRIVAPAEGAYRMSFSRAGLTTLSINTVNLSSGSEMVLDTVLTMSITTLTPVSVEAKPGIHPPPGNPHKYDEFLRRRSLGFGHFITRDEIDSKPQSDTRALFSHVAGIKFRIDGSRWFITSQRCSGGSIPGMGSGSSRNPARDNKYDPLIFINGLQVSRNSNAIEMLREIPPQEIEAIEVYQGAAEMPAEAKGDACFAIFVWLR
jgi:hypothetical protein